MHFVENVQLRFGSLVSTFPDWKKFPNDDEAAMLRVSGFGCTIRPEPISELEFLSNIETSALCPSTSRAMKGYGEYRASRDRFYPLNKKNSVAAIRTKNRFRHLARADSPLRSTFSSRWVV